MGARITGEELAGKVVAGVDTHADTHRLCVLDDGRRVTGSIEFPADADGYAALAEAIGDPDGCAAVGVEGTQSYGAGLVDEPRRRGFRVPGVPGPKREDKRRRGEGKDDGTGAERAARDVIAGKAASVPKRRCGWVDDAGSLPMARNHAADGAVKTSASAESLVMTAPEEERCKWRGLDRDKAMRKALGTGDGGASPLLVSPESLAELWDLDRRKAREPGARTGGIVREHCPAILKACGCGTVTAAELLVSAGENPERLEKASRPSPPPLRRRADTGVYRQDDGRDEAQPRRRQDRQQGAPPDRALGALPRRGHQGLREEEDEGRRRPEAAVEGGGDKVPEALRGAGV